MELFLDDKFRQLWAGRDPFDTVIGLKGTEYRSKEGRRTLQLELSGSSYFLKVHQGIGWKEIFKNLLQLRLPVIGASNEFIAARKLASLGVDTLTPVAFGKKGLNPARQLSFIVTNDLVDTVSLEDYCANWTVTPPPFKQKRALVDLLASVSNTMHGAGINHRDYYICHFLLEKKSLSVISNPRCFLIDLHRAQIRKKTPFRWAVKDIAGLYYSAMDIGLGKKDLYRFIRQYGSGDLRYELTTNKQFWLQVKNKAEKLYFKDHGKHHQSVFQ